MSDDSFSRRLGRLFGRWGRAPKRFGRYRVIRLINSGGMADVYLAYDPELEREVAVKAPRLEGRSGDILNRFRDEAKAVAALNPTYIIPVTDYGEARGRPYLVMPYMPRGSLADRLEKGTYTPRQALPIIVRIAAGLDHAHARKVIHRDVKPGNILFDKEDLAYLSDFGIARYAGGAGDETRQHLSIDGKVRGTSAYMSPEQAIGRPVTEQSDVYSLGIVLRHMLTGDPRDSAYGGETPGVNRVNQPRPLPDEIRAIIERATMMEPTNRYRTAQELVDDLRNFVATHAPADDEAAPPAPPAGLMWDAPSEPAAVERLSRLGPRPAWLIISAILLLALGLGMIAFFWPDELPTPTATAPPTPITEVTEVVPTEPPTPPPPTPPPPSPSPPGPSPAVPSPTVAENTPPAATSTAATLTATATTATTPTPTATLSPSPTISPSPALSLTPPAGPPAVVALTNVFTRAGPGLGYAIDGSLSRGQVVPLVAQDPGGFWYLVELSSGRRVWVSAQHVTGAGGVDPSGAPVAATIPPTMTPTATPTPLPTATATTSGTGPGPRPSPIRPTVTPGCLNPPNCYP